MLIKGAEGQERKKELELDLLELDLFENDLFEHDFLHSAL
jgi:hypothetical protein